MSLSFSTLLAVALSCALADAAALVAVPTLHPSLPVVGLEPNQGQTKAGILFLSPGGTSLAVTAQSVLYSPLGATLNLVASNPNPAVSFSDPLPGLVNSYTGADRNKWVTGIQRYATATLKAVYPGIDAQYTPGTDGALTLHLLCQPGVDPNTIAFQIPQAVAAAESSDGSLVFFFGPRQLGPSLIYAAPLASQATASGPVSLNVSFAIQSTTMFGLAVQGLDATLPLQIAITVSPSFPSQRLFYSPGTQRTVDSNGNTFFATTIADAAGKDAPFPAFAGEACGLTAPTPVPCSDVAIYKYSAAGCWHT